MAGNGVGSERLGSVSTPISRPTKAVSAAMKRTRVVGESNPFLVEFPSRWPMVLLATTNEPMTSSG